MRHRRGPFSEDLRAALNPNAMGPHLLIGALKVRREEVIRRARELGMGDDEVTAVLRDGIEVADGRLSGEPE